MTAEHTEPDRSQPAAGPRRAGKLQGTVEAKFHTGEAIGLVDGRPDRDPRKRIHGLKSFAKRTNMVMSASDRGDPFADYCLAEIHNRLEEVAAFIPEKAKELRALADSRLDPGVRAVDRVAFQSTTWSVDPVKEEFHFGHYASRALYCLTQYDELVLLCKELDYHDVITHDECYRIIKEAGSKVRALLSLGSRYTYTPQCTRAHLTSRNAIALKAIETLVGTGFINMDHYNDIDDICSTFAAHGIAPHRLASSSDASAPAVDPGTGTADSPPAAGEAGKTAETGTSGSGDDAAAAGDGGEAPAGKSPESSESPESPKSEKFGSDTAGKESAPEAGTDSAAGDGKAGA